LRVHQVEDERFYVVEGEYFVQVGDERFQADELRSLVVDRDT
jgi:hypothetical protein